jgi:competence ComEA-like helix-hairpin-helix protein
MLTTDEARALAVLAALVTLGAGIGWLDARQPKLLALTLGDSLALGAVAAPADSGAAPAPAKARPDSSAADSAARPDPGGYTADGRLDLNRATAEELEALPGVGPKMAARILAERARRGRFRSPRDLGKVKGIGPKTLARLLPAVTVVQNATRAK